MTTTPSTELKLAESRPRDDRRQGRKSVEQLDTARLKLVPLNPDEHAEPLHAVYGNPAVMSWWTRPAIGAVAETRRLLAEENGQPGAMLWAIQRAGSSEYIGVAGVLGATAVPGLTWILAEQAWGRGFATEAVTAILEYAFENTGLERVEAWVESTNTQSIAVCRKAGLTERGRLAQRYDHLDQPHEMIVFGRSKERDPASMVHLEPLLSVEDVEATAELLRSALAARVVFTVGEPAEMAGMVFGPWTTGPSVRLVRKPRQDCAPVEFVLDAVSGSADLHHAATESRAKEIEPPVRQPWGRTEFAFRLSEGHRIVVSTPE